MDVREPIVAGQFYPATAEACRREIENLPDVELPEDLPDRPVAGVVPHAGWVFSGPTALAVLRAIRSKRTPKTCVLFGAVHQPIAASAVYASGAWETPLGRVTVDEALAGAILEAGSAHLAPAPEAHAHEHSIEVLLPLLVHVFGEIRVVPAAVLPNGAAPEVGRAAARAVDAEGADAVCLGSTDLTHYGPMYGFAPKGTGSVALRWVREENDRRMVNRIVAMEADQVVPEAETHLNACGAGAVAATVAAARAMGAERGILVHYTTSCDVMQERMGHGDPNAVGYAGVVF